MSVKIIAEIGINHNGDINTCKYLIDAAALAGCDYVKFQKRNPDVCVPEEQKSKIKSTPWGEMTYLEYKHNVPRQGASPPSVQRRRQIDVTPGSL